MIIDIDNCFFIILDFEWFSSVCRTPGRGPLLKYKIFLVNFR